MPADALSLLPGDGEAGAALVRDPRVHLIAFTGSGAVGLEIVRAAAETPDGQGHVKRVIAEMGGKNCVIVDSDADLDDAVPAIVASAFDYAGQKCSAASRVLVHEAVADDAARAARGRRRFAVVGQAESFDTDVPPLIEREAQERLRAPARERHARARIAAGARACPREAGSPRRRWSTGLPAASPLLREEIFGPLLTVEPVPDIDAALEIVDSLPFALTAGLFSRSPRTIEEVARRIPVGNLYVNRAITGAMVGRQPFGGNRRSGIGAQGRRPGLPGAVHRAAGGEREHDAPRARSPRRTPS